MSPPVKLELELILREIRVITDKIREDDDCSNVSGDWKFAAMVLDRSDDENVSSVQQKYFQVVFNILHLLHDSGHGLCSPRCSSYYSHIDDRDDGQ